MIVAQLVLDYLKALAWPIVALVAITVFRTELSALFGRVTEASAFGASVKLAKSAEKAADASVRLPELQEQEGAQRPTTAEPASTLGRMLLAWSDLEGAVRAASEKLNLPSARLHNVARSVQEMHKLDRISPAAVSLARELQRLRNQIVHDAQGATLTAATADDFIAATRRLTAAVNEAAS